MDYRTSAEPREYIDDVPVFCAYDEFVQIGQMRPNPKNPNTHPESQIALLADIIRANGWRNNITVSRRSGMVVRGHGRLLAAIKLGLSAVPVEYQEYGSEAEELADLAADNRLSELSIIDENTLGDLLGLVQEDVPLELAGYPALAAIGTGEETPEPSSKAPETGKQSLGDLSPTSSTAMKNFLDAASADAFGEDSPEYTAFAEKFKPSRTSDDCFTPPAVYLAVRDWVCKEFDINPANIVRPFYPGGDYEKFEYATDSVVVDNPPFSILSRIIDFYVARNIGFVLFAPSLTAMSLLKNRDSICIVFVDGQITYENGAIVKTAFVTNLCPETMVMTSPSLALAIENADKEARAERSQSKTLRRYSYPPQVLTGAMCARLACHASFSVPRNSGRLVASLDKQKEFGWSIYGGGLLLSEKVAAEKVAAEKTAAEMILLSEREWDIVRSLE